MSVSRFSKQTIKQFLVKGTDFRQDVAVPAAPSADIIQTNLVRYYDAGNSTSYGGSGTTWTDLKSSGYNLTLTNGPTFTSSGAGSYFTFDGSNDYAVGNDSGLPSSNSARTFGVWIYPLTSGDSKVSFGYGTFNFNQLIAWYQAAGQSPYNPAHSLNVYGPWAGTFNGDNPITTNAWNLLQFKYAGGTNGAYAYFTNGTKYQNGNTNVFSTTLGGASAFTVAADGAPGNYFNCRIGAVFVYSAALSDSDIVTNYDNTKGRYGL